MGLVVALAALALAGCYSPSLRDCVVTCAAAADCAAGQTCSAGFCAEAPATCGPSGVVDAGGADARSVATDAASADAAPHDAGPMDTLHVTVMGTGQVIVGTVGTCTSSDGPGAAPGGMMMCTYAVPAGAPITAQAQPFNSNHPFDKWADPVCMMQDASCTFTPVPITTIVAQFK